MLELLRLLSRAEAKRWPKPPQNLQGRAKPRERIDRGQDSSRKGPRFVLSESVDELKANRTHETKQICPRRQELELALALAGQTDRDSTIVSSLLPPPPVRLPSSPRALLAFPKDRRDGLRQRQVQTTGFSFASSLTLARSTTGSGTREERWKSGTASSALGLGWWPCVLL